MLLEYEELLKRFENMIQRYSIMFSETMVLEAPYDIFYVSDPETYELYYVSGDTADLPAFGNYEGKKCYEVLQGRQEPCPFCTNSLLSTDMYYIWEYFNPVVKRNFMIKDRMIEWKGHRLRVEVAQNVSDQGRPKEILLEASRQQNLLTHWMRCFVEQEDLNTAFSIILKDLKTYFGARSGFIRSFTSVETVQYLSERGDDPGREIPFVNCPTNEMLERWKILLAGKKFIIVRSVAEIEKCDPEMYEFLNAYGLENLCMAPIFSRNQIVGIIGLGNLTKNWTGLSLLEMLGDCIAASVQKKIMQEERSRILYVDTLTGHLNFEGYKLRAGRFLRENPDKNYALCYCDLKKFKFVNELCGYQTGDRLLKYWGDFLAETLREGETFCRISGDTMSVLHYYEDPEEVRSCFEELVRHLSKFPDFVKKRMRVELSGGVYLIPPECHSLPIGEMLSRATMAQKIAKSRPGSELAFYTEEMRQKEIREMDFIANMHEALRDEEFRLYLQPQIDTRPDGGDILRAEVLVRWHQGDKMIAMPGEFIGLFERNGFIVDLDHYMFECACRYLKETSGKYEKQLILSVNVSRITMLQPNFVRDYLQIKEKYGVEDGMIELEFTENVVVEDLEHFAKLVHNLKDHGFLCAMDDFGAGQSSLNVLQALPLDVLKLDQMFFRDKRNEQRKRIIVASILRMAKSLEMLTVAEGIESEGQMRELTEMGCDYIQGYYYSRPLPAEAFERKYLMEDEKEA